MGERDSYLYDVMRGRVEDTSLGDVHDLGSDMMITFQTRLDDDTPIGFIETHPTPEGIGCHGQVVFDIPEAADLKGPKWQLLSLDPLHIEPSVLCRGCGHHGFVRGGRWESC